MRIVALVENTPCADGCEAVHGLSLWIETANHRVLMDAGPSEVLLSNAHSLGIDLAKAEALFVSHGHYDHTGGVMAFAAVNPQANIYMRRTADGAFYSASSGDGTLHAIGIDPSILTLPRLHLTDGLQKLDDDLILFGDVTGRRCLPESNLRLYKKEENAFVQDRFDHEQHLVVREGERSVLFSGCAHSGILNILDRYYTLFGHWPDAVVSGFHMKKSAPYTEAETETILHTAHELQKLPCRFYTCHCTGLAAYEQMKAVMGDQLSYLACGESICL